MPDYDDDNPLDVAGLVPPRNEYSMGVSASGVVHMHPGVSVAELEPIGAL